MFLSNIFLCALYDTVCEWEREKFKVNFCPVFSRDSPSHTGLTVSFHQFLPSVLFPHPSWKSSCCPSPAEFKWAQKKTRLFGCDWCVWEIKKQKRMFFRRLLILTVFCVSGEKGTLTHGSVVDGRFEGFIKTHQGTYYVEPSERYLKDKDVPFHSIIYHEDDISKYLPLCVHHWRVLWGLGQLQNVREGKCCHSLIFRYIFDMWSVGCSTFNSSLLKCIFVGMY